MADDTTRTRQRDLTEDERKLIDAVKMFGNDLIELLRMKPGRESSIAITKIEEAVMWAVKGITA